MEENKNQKKRKSIVDSSVVLSFVVSIVAIFSLAMFGIVSNQDTDISYAVDPAAGATDETVETTVFVDRDNQINAIGAAEDRYGEAYVTSFPLYRYTLENANGQQVYCIEYKKGEPGEERYEIINPSTDLTEEEQNAIMYIINSKLKITMAEGRENQKKYVETWVKQAAIWLYLNDTIKLDVIPNPSPRKLETSTGESTKEGILGAHTIELIHDTAGTNRETIYTNNTLGDTVKELVDAAKKFKGYTSNLVLNKESDDFTVGKDSDGKVAYYQSSLITVTSTDNLQSYAITFSEEGIEAVDEDGNKLDISNPISDIKKFYVRIPADKVKYPDSKKIDIKVDGIFVTPTVMVGQAMQNPDTRQRIVLLGDKSLLVKKGIEVVVTPDTGVNATQAIYFIGLIVLLCGVGIVYANAKPVQSKQ